MSILTFKGHKTNSGKNVGYITRGSACESISFHNLDELEAESEFEKQTNALSYSYNREDEETGRTHYRMVLSFENTQDTEKAKDMAHDYLNDNFKDSRAIVAIHQDTDHTHAHIWIDARNIDDKKLHLSKNDYKTLDDKWAKQCDREFGTNRFEEYSAKKLETKEWKKEKVQSKENRSGKQEKPNDKPERYKNNINSEYFREKEAKDKGVTYSEQSRTGGNQRTFEIRESISEEANSRVNQSQRELDATESTSKRTESATSELHQGIDRMAERERGIDR